MASRKKLEEPAYKDNFADGYEHALKDAYDVLADHGFHDACILVGDMQGEYAETVAGHVRKSVREWRAAKRKAAAGAKKRRLR